MCQTGDVIKNGIVQTYDADVMSGPPFFSHLAMFVQYVSEFVDAYISRNYYNYVYAHV